MDRRSFFGLPFLGFLPKEVFKEKKKDRKKFVYRYFVPWGEGKRLYKYATYLEGEEWINLKGQNILGNEKIWKMRYGKNALFLFEWDFERGLCTKEVVGEKDWLYFVFDKRSQIG